MRALEEAVSARLRGRPCVGVANGTDALVIALHALDLGPGDEVVTTPYTFYATAEAIARVGATPVFADIDPDTLTLDPDAVAERITDATKAILPVDIFGHPADMTPFLTLAAENSLVVVEDAAQAFGAHDGEWPVGTMGDAVTFSFFPTKNFPGIGDGGMVVCADQTLAERVRRLRFHGSKDKVTFQEVGYNSRLDEVQAAVIRTFLPHVDDWNAHRRQVAAWYAEAGPGRADDPAGRAPRRPPRLPPVHGPAPGPRPPPRGPGPRTASAPRCTTACPCTCNRCSRAWATPRATCRWPRRPRARRWRCPWAPPSRGSRSTRWSPRPAGRWRPSPARNPERRAA